MSRDLTYLEVQKEYNEMSDDDNISMDLKNDDEFWESWTGQTAPPASPPRSWKQSGNENDDEPNNLNDEVLVAEAVPGDTPKFVFTTIPSQDEIDQMTSQQHKDLIKAYPEVFRFRGAYLKNLWPVARDEFDIPHGVCYYCLDKGHRRQKCTKPAVRCCHNCGRRGVIVQECPRCWRESLHRAQLDLLRGNPDAARKIQIIEQAQSRLPEQQQGLKRKLPATPSSPVAKQPADPAEENGGVVRRKRVRARKRKRRDLENGAPSVVAVDDSNHQPPPPGMAIWTQQGQLQQAQIHQAQIHQAQIHQAQIHQAQMQQEQMRRVQEVLIHQQQVQGQQQADTRLSSMARLVSLTGSMDKNLRCKVLGAAQSNPASMQNLLCILEDDLPLQLKLSMLQNVL